MTKNNSIAQGIRLLLEKMILVFRKIVNADMSKPGTAVPLIFIQLIAIVALLGYTSGFFDRQPNTPELVEKLEFESLRGLEYFNSTAFDKIRSQNDSLTAKQLVKAIEKPNRRYLLPLLALRQLSEAQFDSLDRSLSAGILTDALKQDQTFNDWGRPDLYWSENRDLEAPVAAMIDLGEQAVSGLERLLGEKRNAPLWGSQERLPRGTDSYQVNDYAIALIYKSTNLELPPDGFPKTRRARDALIDSYVETHLKSTRPDLYKLLKPSILVVN